MHGFKSSKKYIYIHWWHNPLYHCIITLSSNGFLTVCIQFSTIDPCQTKTGVKCQKKNIYDFYSLTLYLSVHFFNSRRHSTREGVLYLGIWLDDKLSFGVHIESILKKLHPKLGVYYCLKKGFPFTARKRLVLSTFLSVLDYGYIIYMHASSSYLKKLDVVYHSALRFITGAAVSTHHCNLYDMVQWTSLQLRRKIS